MAPRSVVVLGVGLELDVPEAVHVDVGLEEGERELVAVGGQFMEECGCVEGADLSFRRCCSLGTRR